MFAATEVVPPIILNPRIPHSPEPSPPSPSDVEIQSVHDFVTSFFSIEAAAPQEPTADKFKLDIQADIGHVAVT